MSLLVALILLGVALWLRATWLGSGLDALVAGVLPDDAFYYFEIALRLLRGQGVSFDGETPATGFHPLWLAMVAPLFAGAEPGALAPVRRVLWLSCGLSAVCAFNVFRFARHETRHDGASLGVALAFSANPWLVRESLNGLETGLVLCIASFVLLAATRWFEAPGPGRALHLGGLSALAVLARSDSALLLAPIYVALTAQRPPWRTWLRAALPPALAVAGLAAASLALTGSPLQSSAASVPWLLRANWARLYGDDLNGPGPRLLWESLSDAATQLGPAAAGALAVSLLACGVLARRSPPRRLRAGLAATLLLGGGVLLLHAVHGYVRWFPRSWYFAPWVLVTHALVAVAVAGCWALPARRARAAALAGLAALGALELRDTLSRRAHPSYPHQLEMYDAGLALAANVPDGGRIGAFNAGIVAYLSGARVVNLDGAVNEDAARHIRRRTLGAYLRRLGIEYLVDYPVMWSHSDYAQSTGPYFGPAFPLVRSREVARFDREGVGWPYPEQYVSLTRFDWHGAWPWDGALDVDLGILGSRRYLLDGWSSNLVSGERRFVATRGPVGGLRVPLQPGRAYRLEIRAAAAPGAPVDVALNGAAIGRLAPDAPGFRNYVLSLPAGLVRAANELSFRAGGTATLRLERLRFRVHDAAAPSGYDRPPEEEHP